MLYCFHNSTNYILKLFISSIEYIIFPDEEKYISVMENAVLFIGREQASYTFYEGKELNYHIITTARVTFTHLPSNERISISLKGERYQHFTYYEYYLLQGVDQNEVDIFHEVVNEERIRNDYRNADKNKNIKAILSESLFDATLDGGILCVILGFVFNIWVALVAYLSTFLLVLLINIFISKGSKRRKCTLFRNPDQPDSIPYFLEHINDFCVVE